MIESRLLFIPMGSLNKNIILLVDQNPTRRNNLSSRLRMLGYTIEIASSGFQALHLLEDSNFNKYNQKRYRLVLVLDDSEDMPGREIMLLMREVVKEKNKLPILLGSGDNDPEHILNIIKEGANDYIVDVKNDAKIVSKVTKVAPLLE